MKIYSEITGRSYTSVDACLAAEKEAKERAERVRKEAEEKKFQKEARKQEVDDAIVHAAELIKKYYNDYHDFEYRYNGNGRLPWFFNLFNL